jgi:hypothetical protein
MAKSPHGKAKWPQLCQYFRLVGGPPGERSLDFQAFGREHAETWKKLEKEHGLKTGIYEKYKWMLEYDLTAVRSLGFNEKINAVDSWKLTFERMRRVKIIPANLEIGQ